MNYLIYQAMIHPVVGDSFIGDVFIRNGKIEELGRKLIKEEKVFLNRPLTILPHLELLRTEDINSYEMFKVINGQGHHLYPGLIDVHTHLGLYDEGTGWAGNDANEKSEAMTPHIRALDGVYPLDIGFKDAVQAGVTCVHVMPGSANIIGGTTSVIKTHGKSIDKMLVKELAGLKMALGENPKKHHSDNGDLTRMGIMGLLRETFLTVKYDLSENERKLPRYKPIIKALNKEIPVRIHAHRADDIMSAIRFAKEFDLNLRIEHCTEGHLIVEELKEYIEEIGELHVSIGPTMTRRSKIELRNKSWDVYAKLVEAGVNVSITTDHPYVPIQYLNIASAIAVREGLDKDDALRGITINPALNLGIQDRVGSIEEGKDADLVLWNGEIFDYMSKPLFTMINGEIVYEYGSFSS